MIPIYHPFFSGLAQWRMLPNPELVCRIKFIHKSNNIIPQQPQKRLKEGHTEIIRPGALSPTKANFLSSQWALSVITPYFSTVQIIQGWSLPYLLGTKKSSMCLTTSSRLSNLFSPSIEDVLLILLLDEAIPWKNLVFLSHFSHIHQDLCFPLISSSLLSLEIIFKIDIIFFSS